MRMQINNLNRLDKDTLEQISERAESLRGRVDL